ncbi:MAG TPA: hypothetical protein DEO84_11545 [candidate division Zixibacteria bacterium]|jgi:hypothetical protein|nr:hypothetical protein [candidate division Zixibacteria bacterium]HBZ01941.1 hypothetical protein [candidate division Zixibacteria bacterium]
MTMVRILISSVMLLAIAANSGFAQRNSTTDTARVYSNSLVIQDSLNVQKQVDNLQQLRADLLTGKPTLAFFYYSVACSCTAAKCAIASAAIDSIPELNGNDDSLNFSKIDAYLVPEAESLFNLMIMPAVVYYGKDGEEVNRIEWGTSREAIKRLIDHPEEQQEPID